jgi:GNAT superfamily N-acetyltransferase
VNVHTEQVDSVFHELDDLLEDYFARTVAKEGLPPLRMNWLAYIELNNRGDLILFTARDHWDDLLGFVMYHIHPHLHHMGVIGAACDILAVNVDQRNNGIATELIERAEPVLRNRGVQYVTHQFRTCYDVKPLFPKLGYKLIEQGYMKEIG